MPRLNKKYSDKFFILKSERERLLVFKRRSLIPEKVLARHLNLSRSQLHMRIYGIISFTVDDFGKLCRLVDCTMNDILRDRQGNIEFKEAS